MTFDEVLLLKEVLRLDPVEVTSFLIKDAPQGTWYAIADWLTEHMPQPVIKAAMMRAFEALDPISQAAAGSSDEARADRLRDDMDILWRALSEESQTELEALWRRT